MLRVGLEVLVAGVEPGHLCISEAPSAFEGQDLEADLNLLQRVEPQLCLLCASSPDEPAHRVGSGLEFGQTLIRVEWEGGEPGPTLLELAGEVGVVCDPPWNPSM